MKLAHYLITATLVTSPAFANTINLCSDENRFVDFFDHGEVVIRLADVDSGHTYWDTYVNGNQVYRSEVAPQGLAPAINITPGKGIFTYSDGQGDIVFNDPLWEEWYETMAPQNSSVIPEPSSLVLALIGLSAVVFREKRIE